MLKTFIVRLVPVLGLMKNGPLPRRSVEKKGTSRESAESADRLESHRAGGAGKHGFFMSLCVIRHSDTPQKASPICYLHLFSIAFNTLF